MLHLLLSMAAIAGAEAPGVDEPRLAAAALLRSVSTEDAGPGLALLRERAVQAARLLGDARPADQLAALVAEAERRSADDPERAALRLAEALAVLAEDLAFEPLLEAALPAGFPPPTPVREIEVKRYPAYRMARTEMSGWASQGAFWKLFRHIQTHEIAMTAPVEMAFAEESGELRGSAMAFLYGTPELGAAGPDGPVDVVDVAPARVVSLGCRGESSEPRLAAMRAELLAWIAARPELAVDGELRVMGYNSPRVPTRRRYFEVQIPVTDPRPVNELVVDFSAPDEAGRWFPIDDVVMGGRSSSGLARTGEGTCVFAGRVSLEDGGGFASVRARELRQGLRGASALAVRARGDGRTYRLRLFTRESPLDVAYQASFATVDGEWTEHVFEPQDFAPSRRGRPVPGAAPLVFDEVESVGLLIAGGQAGPFRLELRSIERR